MISEMEETCRLLLKEKFLPDEWDSVGTYVNVRHLAATPVGSNVDFKAKIISVNSKKVLYEVVALDSIETIGDGNHERHIIHVPTFRERFINKQKELNKDMA
jgi:predicted thioesterase